MGRIKIRAAMPPGADVGAAREPPRTSRHSAGFLIPSRPYREYDVTALDPRLRHRRSVRLPGDDYRQAGAYFVTVCAQDRAVMFGEIVDGSVHLNEFGEAATSCWMWLAQQYEYVDLDEWIVMPNHLHGIIVLGGEDDRKGGKDHPPKHKSLGSLIGAFKTVSSRRINEVRGTPNVPVWQRNYYEHVVRNEASLQRIREYIAGNPGRWAEDPENPNAVRNSPAFRRGTPYSGRGPR